MQQMTYAIAMAAARDAGNRAMWAGNRTVWSVGDYRKACVELERLLKLIPEQPK
jgi:hypothetical protein